MATIQWSESDDPCSDLCGRLDGKYVDVTFHVRGTWSVLFNNVRLRDDFLDRDAAKTWAEKSNLIDAFAETSRN